MFIRKKLFPLVRYVSNYSSIRPNSLPFARAKKGTFFQQSPFLENSFEGDAFLQRNLKRILSNDVFQSIQNELSVFGADAATKIYRLGRQCELNPPYLKVQDAWANPRNEVVTCESWSKLKGLSAKEGLVAMAYERKYGEASRLIQMVKNYLFYPSSGLYSCPLAMTDGAAKTLQVSGLEDQGDAFRNLTSRNPDLFWTSGQWMTEKRGGSDVAGGTETIAIGDPNEENQYKLYGYKFFSSATDADVALTLARIVDPSTGKITPGSKGLSLFLVKVNQPANLQVIRLKQKLGTRQLPTGELLLDGMQAQLISPNGRGVSSIAPMLSVTRLHNAVASVASMRRIISLARDYSQRRVAFGKSVSNHALHTKTMAEMELECRAGLVLLLEAARLLGLEESRVATSSEQQLLRLLLPLLKLYTGKQCVSVVSEGIECFGGQGYMEDTGIPVILRDAQVTPIWEGTTNILSLDVLRAINKSKGEVLTAFQSRIQSAAAGSSCSECSDRLIKAGAQLMEFSLKGGPHLEYHARDFAFGLARTLAGTFLLEHSSWNGATESDRYAARRWLTQRDLLPHFETSGADLEHALVFDGYDPQHLLSPLF